MRKSNPIYKGGSKSDPSNYCLISVLPTISKIFEKYVNMRLMNFLNKYKLIHETQSGFRQKKNNKKKQTNKLLDCFLHW